MLHCIGLMSGTSMDGVDAALLKTDGEFALTSVAHEAMAYPSGFQLQLKAVEFAVQQCRGNVSQARADFPRLATTYYQSTTIADTTILPSTFDDIITQLTHYHAQAVEKNYGTCRNTQHQCRLHRLSRSNRLSRAT